MPIETIVPLSLNLFLKPKALYITEEQWQNIPKHFGISTDVEKAIFRTPSDFNFVQSNEIKNNTSKLLGNTRTRNVEDVDICTFPIKNLPQGKDIKDLFTELQVIASNFKVACIINDTHLFGNEIKKTDFYAYVIGACEVLNQIKPLIDVTILNFLRDEFFIDTIKLNTQSLIPFLAGVKQNNIKYIKDSFQVDVYYTWPSTNNYELEPIVYIAGSIYANVLAAKELLTACLNKCQSTLFYQELTGISPGKLEYVRRYFKKEIQSLMNQYGSFVFISSDFVGFQSTSVTMLKSLTKEFTLTILQSIAEIRVTMDSEFEFTDEMVIDILSAKDEQQLIVRDDEISNQFILIRNSSQKSKVNGKSTTPLHSLKKYLEDHESQIEELKAIFEIHPDYDDFISGKKNGKLTRIMEKSQAQLDLNFEEDDKNMFLSIISNKVNNLESAFTLLLDELPCEGTFFIPEVYHRPAIGSGGSIIQTTMRKHNVFIQFSNTFLLPQSGLSFVRFDNVIIRCPFKNRKGIDLAIEDLKVLIQEYSEQQPSTNIRLSPAQYKHVLFEHINTIGHLEKQNNVFLDFPQNIPKTTVNISIRGNDTSSIQCADEVTNRLYGFERTFQLSECIPNDKLLSNKKLQNELVVPLFIRLHAFVSCQDKTFTLVYDKAKVNNKDFENQIQQYLEENGLIIEDKKTVSKFITDTTAYAGFDQHDSPRAYKQQNPNMSPNYSQNSYKKPIPPLQALAEQNSMRGKPPLLKQYGQHSPYYRYGYAYAYNYVYDYNNMYPPPK